MVARQARRRFVVLAIGASACAGGTSFVLNASPGSAASVANKPETAQLIRHSFVAEYGVSSTHSGYGVGLFDRQSGKLLRQLSLIHFQDRAFGGWDVNRRGDLIYTESDLGPHDGTLGGPTQGCDGVLYSLDRRTGRTRTLLHVSNKNVRLPAAGPTRGTWAVQVENCPENQTELHINYHGRPVVPPDPVRDATPIGWTPNGRSLLLAKPGGSYARLNMSKSGPRLTNRPLPITPDCITSLAGADAYGDLVAQLCSAGKRKGNWLVQMPSNRTSTTWRRRLPFCAINLIVDPDSRGRRVMLSNGLHGHCHAIDGHYEIARITAHGIHLTGPLGAPRFFESPTL